MYIIYYELLIRDTQCKMRMMYVRTTLGCGHWAGISWLGEHRRGHNLLLLV